MRTLSSIPLEYELGRFDCKYRILISQKNRIELTRMRPSVPWRFLWIPCSREIDFLERLQKTFLLKLLKPSVKSVTT